MFDDCDIADLRDFLLVDCADVGTAIRDANRIMSLVQAIEAAVDGIRQILLVMEDLAEKEVHRYCTMSEKAAMQQKMLELAEQVNAIVDRTTITTSPDEEPNRLLSASGQTIDEPVGSGRTMHIFAWDMRFPVDRIDLTRNGKGALALIRETLRGVNEYVDYLQGQIKLLEETVASMDERIAKHHGIEVLQINQAGRTIAAIETLAEEMPDALVLTQANLTRDEVLHALREPGQTCLVG